MTQLTKVFFLDQSGALGGAELCLLDVAQPISDRCLVGLLADGPFRIRLEQAGIPVQILTNQTIQVRKSSGVLAGVRSLGSLIAPVQRAVQLSREFDLIYANTPKALVVGAMVSFLSRRPLVYHLHDILSLEHFSQTNLMLLVTLANRFARRVIANSQATAAAFVAAGGRATLTQVIYNGFDRSPDQNLATQRDAMRQQLELNDRFVVGCFSRLSPWKGQHILIEALAHCPEQIVVVVVGDALFGEDAYGKQLRQMVVDLDLERRVRFLGFRSDVPALMSACDLVVHTSTAPEPFGRVIVEAMLAGRPVIAAAAGGVMELIEQRVTGWLVTPGDALELAAMVQECYSQPEQRAFIANQAQASARERFQLEVTNYQIEQLLTQVRSQ